MITDKTLRDDRIAVLSPITGCDDVRLVATFETQSIIRDWQSSFGIDVAPVLGRYESFWLFECCQTGLQFFYPFDLFGPQELYEQLEEFEWYYMLRWEHVTALCSMSAGDRILDIGAGSGAFVESGYRRGLNITGIEINAFAVALAQQQGRSVIQSDLAEFSRAEAARFDVVCAFQVVEHVPNPREFLNQCLGLLRPNGRLILCVPNADSFLKYAYDLLDMPPHHMSRWTQKTIRTLERFFPFRADRILYEPLGTCHIEAFVSSQQHQYASTPLVGGLLYRKRFAALYKRLLRAGLRQFAIGHTLYAELRKTDRT